MLASARARTRRCGAGSRARSAARSCSSAWPVLRHLPRIDDVAYVPVQLRVLLVVRLDQRDDPWIAEQLPADRALRRDVARTVLDVELRVVDPAAQHHQRLVEALLQPDEADVPLDGLDRAVGIRPDRPGILCRVRAAQETRLVIREPLEPRLEVGRLVLVAPVLIVRDAALDRVAQEREIPDRPGRLGEVAERHDAVTRNAAQVRVEPAREPQVVRGGDALDLHVAVTARKGLAKDVAHRLAARLHDVNVGDQVALVGHADSWVRRVR